jgi:predicted DNA-binding protein with PD1-like motif
MLAYALRLKPGQDLKNSLDAFALSNQIAAGCVLTCVGSLDQAVLRLADQPGAARYEDKFEIVSLVGTISAQDAHLHISISDSSGQTVGGHLLEGCRIYTTAEIVIGVVENVQFTREYDPASGYNELVVGPFEERP